MASQVESLYKNSLEGRAPEDNTSKLNHEMFTFFFGVIGVEVEHQTLKLKVFDSIPAESHSISSLRSSVNFALLRVKYSNPNFKLKV